MQTTSKNKAIVSVSDIVSYLFCPRKLYLIKVKKLVQAPTREMLIGRLKHRILENFSKRERELVSKITKDYDKLELVFMYEEFLTGVADTILHESKSSLVNFKVTREEVIKKVMSSFIEDIKIRIIIIKEKITNGFFKEELWNSLPSIFISEISLESEHYGLRGRIDRIEISKIDNSIIPYEIKSRDQKIFPSDEIQLTAYAMLLEDNYKTKITKGIIEVGGLKKEVEITEKLKDTVLKLADEIRNMGQNLVPPMQNNFNKCKSCSLNQDCPDF